MTLFGFIEVASIICALAAGGACVMDWRKRHNDGGDNVG